MDDRWQPIKCPKCDQDHDAKEVYIYSREFPTPYHEESAIDRAYYAGQLCLHMRWLAARRETLDLREETNPRR